MRKLVHQSSEHGCSANSVSAAGLSRAAPDEPTTSEDGRDETIASLREAVKARDDLLAMAAHELRNPLTAIQMRIELIRQAEQDHQYEHLRLQLEHLGLLLERFAKRTTMLLNVVQLASDNLPVDFSEFDLSQLVTQIVNDHKPLLARSGSEISLKIEGTIIAWLDAVSTSEIVENLLSNAIKYGQGKPIELMVTASGGNVVIVVRDHGIGIAPEDAQRIFGRFERAVARGYRAGFGLGLWITHKLVEEMRGSIEVVGKKGVGSVFTVTLPLDGKATNEQ
jgi:two-component system, OmpR family, sensor kinase